MKEIIFTQAQLEQKLKEWQQRLRLQDWIIKVGIVREKQFCVADRAAEVVWTLEKKMASIRILDPLDYPEDCMEPQDMESSLVHELLHLHLAPLRYHFGDKSEIYDTFEEQAIESIAYSLVVD
ncbi:hypothetical protein [Bacillus norwichensis]|uniref:Uncharacterized protein n=1 Tax=Bacillus norwichensis TaxID=2762217 RepID=A0ABR8VRQ5_9BACI|nr:hypothetical protein [Bacillus norwichensis]MBD8007456.1 hypothetical protein [Bacillus norwichensis]